MGKRKPFTKRQRHAATQHGFGHRALNCWGRGDLPAPYAEGDVVFWDGTPNERLHGQTGPYFVITYCCSIDEGDAWYARVSDLTEPFGSDRLHIAWSDRSDWDEDCDWMQGFTLYDCADPAGRETRASLLESGWAFQPRPTCPTCGQLTGDDPGA